MPKTFQNVCLWWYRMEYLWIEYKIKYYPAFLPSNLLMLWHSVWHLLWDEENKMTHFFNVLSIRAHHVLWTLKSEQTLSTQHVDCGEYHVLSHISETQMKLQNKYTKVHLGVISDSPFPPSSSKCLSTTWPWSPF